MKNSCDAMTVEEKIRQLREQVLGHCCLYYWFSSAVLLNKEWDELALELIAYQEAYPESVNINFFDEDFDSFEITDGFQLPFENYKAVEIAEKIYKEYHKSEIKIK